MHIKTMTVEQLVKDGQLQCDVLEAVLDMGELKDSQPCIVLVVREDSTQCRMMLDGLGNNSNRCIMPMLGTALSEIASRAMWEDPEALAVMGRFFGLFKERRATKGKLDEMLTALNGKETEDEQQD